MTASTMRCWRPSRLRTRDWEKLNYFEACLPIEELARRGRDTLRFGPMKPVGLRDPRTGKQPHAVVQLRRENLRADSYNIVGFQNHLKYGEQQRVFRMIPGLENARFLRYGQIHRNTYINAPSLLTATLQMKAHPNVLFAGQICGVEGYTESIASGLMAGVHAAALANGANPCRRRAPRRLARWCTTSRMPTQSIFSRQTSPSTCCRRSMSACATAPSGIGCNASGRCASSMDGSRKSA